MENYKEECINKSITINKLRARITELEVLVGENKKEILEHIRLKEHYRDILAPTKESLDSLSAVYGRLLRKAKRG